MSVLEPSVKHKMWAGGDKLHIEISVPSLFTTSPPREICHTLKSKINKSNLDSFNKYDIDILELQYSQGDAKRERKANLSDI